MDRAWWRYYLDEIRATFNGHLVAPIGLQGVVREQFDHYRNSGAGAIALAAHWGAGRVILLGYDSKVTDKTHWHGDHPTVLGNAGAVGKWPAQFEQLKDEVKGVRIVNCSRDTALTCFTRMNLDDALRENKPPIVVEGMHGLGDNLHQRGVVRELMNEYTVWLESPWPCLYHDLDISIVNKGSRLRTQAKNAAREAGKFDMDSPAKAKHLRVSYPPAMIRQHGSVYAAMSAQCNVPMGDFRLPIPQEWTDRASALMKGWGADKPIMIYRPLVERSEWGGCHTRNPETQAYAALFESVRDRFFVVSVADLEPGKEWIVGRAVNANVEYHAGELDIEVLAALVKQSALVFTSPGFAVILAQSVGTPVVGIFGGYEDSSSFTAGEKFAPSLWIDPIEPCQCFSHNHACKKAIDVAKWLPILDKFAKGQYENVDRRLQA